MGDLSPTRQTKLLLASKLKFFVLLAMGGVYFPQYLKFRKPILLWTWPSGSSFYELPQVIGAIVDRAARLVVLWPYALAPHIPHAADRFPKVLRRSDFIHVDPVWRCPSLTCLGFLIRFLRFRIPDTVGSSGFDFHPPTLPTH